MLSGVGCAVCTMVQESHNLDVFRCARRTLRLQGMLNGLTSERRQGYNNLYSPQFNANCIQLAPAKAGIAILSAKHPTFSVFLCARGVFAREHSWIMILQGRRICGSIACQK